MPQQIVLTPHFAVPVFNTVLDDFPQHREALLQLILSLRETSPGINRSNLNMWHSENNFHTRNEPVVQWLNQQIGDFARGCLAQLDKQLAQADLLLHSCWANVGEYGAWHAPHNHFPAQWSGVVYVSVDACINLEDRSNKSGKIEFLNPFPLSHAYGQPNGVLYQPKNGLILLFPAVLQHLVHPNLTDGQRVAISFNLAVAPPQGS